MTTGSRVWVTPILHPARIVRGSFELEPPQELYLRRLVDRTREGREPPSDASQSPRRILFPVLSQVRDWYTKLCIPCGISLDLETVGDEILCVGMVPFDLQRGTLSTGLCLRFRKRLGVRYWRSWLDHMAAVEILGQVLAHPDIALVMHNGVGHDVPILLDHGFEVRGRIVDTMTLAHTAYSEMPRGLQFLATLHLWAGVWKSMVHEDDDDDG